MIYPKTEEERVAEFFRVTDELRKMTSPFVAAIYGSQDPIEGRLVGSGSFFRTGEQVLLLSARHVAEEACQDYKIQSHSAGNGRPPVAIETPFITSAQRLHDLAILPIDSTKIDKCIQPFEITELAETSNDLEGDILFVHGFAGEKSRFTAFMPGIYSESTPYGTVLGTSTLSGFDPNIHFAIEYPQPEPQRDIQGREVYIPDPHGMSGSSIWQARRAKYKGEWAIDRAKLVGIAHRWDQKNGSLVATRVEVVKDFLEPFLAKE